MNDKILSNTSKTIANLVVDELIDNNIISENDLKRSWEIIEEEVRVRLLLTMQVESLKQAAQKQRLKNAYIDGWTDGNAHKNYASTEHKAAIEKDWANSTTKFIEENKDGECPEYEV